MNTKIARKEFDMTIKPILAWGIGAFWDAKKRRLYVLPLPCLGVVIDFGPGIDAEWQELARQGLRINAIRAHRKARGSGLKEALDAVDAYAATCAIGEQT